MGVSRRSCPTNAAPSKVSAQQHYSALVWSPVSDRPTHQAAGRPREPALAASQSMPNVPPTPRDSPELVGSIASDLCVDRGSNSMQDDHGVLPVVQWFWICVAVRAVG